MARDGSVPGGRTSSSEPSRLRLLCLPFFLFLPLPPAAPLPEPLLEPFKHLKKGVGAPGGEGR